MTTFSQRFLALSVMLVLGACGAKSKASTPKEAAATETGVYEYGIGPEDMLRIDVWKNDDLSRDVRVRPDGFISLPLVQDVQVTGLTAAELSRILRNRYKDFVEDPEISVTVIEANSYKIYVLGKVVKSGMFPVKNPVTVLQAISMAGGFTPFADTDGIIIIRKRDGKDLRMSVNYDKIVEGKHPEQNLVLQPGDTLVVP